MQSHKLNQKIFNDFADRLERQLVVIGGELDPKRHRRWNGVKGEVFFVTPHNRVQYRVTVTDTRIAVHAHIESVERHESRDAFTYINPPYDLTAWSFILHEFAGRIERFLD